MKIHFCKMHGLGNDFVVIDATQQSCPLTPNQIRCLADRHTGVGFDQLLLLEPTQNPAASFYYRIYNADGSSAEQCGNGARCVARYSIERGLAPGSTVCLETAKGLVTATLLADQSVLVAMGIPHFPTGQQQTLRLGPDILRGLAVDMGNPHIVITVANIHAIDATRWGAALNADSVTFPQGVNVEWMQIISPTVIQLRVYERGAGETAACGSGACAAVAAACHRNQLNRTEPIQVIQTGGDLIIHWPTPLTDLTMRGPATFVFDGEVVVF